MRSTTRSLPSNVAPRRIWPTITILIAFVAVGAVVITPQVSAGTPRAEVCHTHSRGQWQLRSLPAKGKAIDAHLGHGDGRPGRAVPGTAGSSFDENCVPVSNHLLMLQSPGAFTANPYLALSRLDGLAASLVLEPLADIAPDGTLVPVLAEQIPTEANGGISADRTQIIWNLREGVLWSDGTPLTADDAVTTWDFWRSCPVFCDTDVFEGVASVEALDTQRVRVTFEEPTVNPLVPFVGYLSPILQGAQFAPCVGADPFACLDQHFMPIGTGPYVISEFVSEESVQYEASPTYRGATDGLPFFRTAEIQTGDGAEANARTVLEDGEADFARGLLDVPPDVLATIATGGRGEVVTSFSANVEHLNLNQTNPDGVPPSGYDNGNNPNPFFFANEILHDAMSMAIDRSEISETAYGVAGRPTCNMWILGSQTSTNNDSCLTQDIAGANALLDVNGYLDTDNDGVRETPGGVALEFDFVTSTNPARQAVQALIKGYWAQIGIATNLQNQPPNLFFGPGTGVSIWEFFTDIQMFTNGAAQPEAFGYLSQWTIDQIPDPVTNPQGGNIPRLASASYDALIAQIGATPMDDPARDALVVEANDLLVEYALIPLVHRGIPSAVGNDIVGAGNPSGWDSEYTSIEMWRRTATS